MKTIKDYTNLPDEEISKSIIANVWCYIIRDRINDVEISESEYLCFLQVFLQQLPHDWDGVSFMGVRLHRK